MKLDWFSIVIVAFVAAVGGYAAYIQIRARRNGIETVAVVTGVKEEWERTAEDIDSIGYTYTVEYKNFDGVTVAAALGGLSNAKKDLREGDRIVIRYLKDRQDYPIMVRKL